MPDMPHMSTFRYYICGLTLEAPFKFEGLPVSILPPDAVVRFGECHPPSKHQITFQGVCCTVAPECVYFDLEGITTLMVLGGKEIVIGGGAYQNTDALQAFILGACLGVLLIQRGQLVLHASVVEKNGVTVAFAGAGGAGKSTLVSLLVEHGFRVLADNIAVIESEGHSPPQIIPSSPQVHLWAAALEKLNFQTPYLKQIRSEVSKFSLSLDEGQFLSVPTELNTICILCPWNKAESRFETIVGPERLLNLVNVSFRMKIVKGLGLEQLHFQQIAKLAQHANIVKLFYAHDWNLNQELIAIVEESLFR
tara:strand:+ start:2018 stop:2941 length:924 start_codon:yes stop_codon:yes gene_type:complete